MPIQPNHHANPRYQPIAPIPQPPRPESPATAYLRAMCRDPHGAMASGAFPREPAGSFEMPPATAEAARQFRSSVLAVDPTGFLRHNGEFSQSFRLQGGQVLPNGPLAHEMGNSVEGGPMVPGTFTNIHSHNFAPGDLRNDFPSPNDQLSARGCAKMFGQAHELMYHPISDRFFAYSGSVPPVFFEARFPGQPPAAQYGPPHANCLSFEPLPAFLLPPQPPVPAPYLPPSF